MRRLIRLKKIYLSVSVKFLIIIISCCIFLCAAEFIIRLYKPYENEILKNTDRIILFSNKKNEPFRTFGFDPYKKINETIYISDRFENIFSIKRPANTYRIICFGGSTSENIRSGRPYTDHLKNLVSKYSEKNIEVINLSFSGYSSAHSLILLSLNCISWSPDLLIISHNINDLMCSYFPDFKINYSHTYKNDFYMPDYKKVFSLSNVMFKNSHLYWFIKGRFLKLDNESLKIKRKKYTYDISKTAADTFKRNLQTFFNIAHSKNIKVMFATQPLCENEEYFIDQMAFFPFNSDVIYPLHSEFISHHNTFNDIIRQTAEENNCFLVDNRKIITDKSFFMDHVHYTEKGVIKLAENFSESVKKMTDH